MNLDQFKAFLEGFEHAFKHEAPSAEQWQIIKDKLHQVDAHPSQATPRGVLDELVHRPKEWGKIGGDVQDLPYILTSRGPSPKAVFEAESG